jgi:hypothetical protein
MHFLGRRVDGRTANVGQNYSGLVRDNGG